MLFKKEAVKIDSFVPAVDAFSVKKYKRVSRKNDLTHILFCMLYRPTNLPACKGILIGFFHAYFFVESDSERVCPKI